MFNRYHATILTHVFALHGNSWTFPMNLNSIKIGLQQTLHYQLMLYKLVPFAVCTNTDALTGPLPEISS